MPSIILNTEEQATCYHLLTHPLTDCSAITHFRLLFRSSLYLDCFKMLMMCKDRDNLIMIFRTEFDHVFALHLKTRLTFNTMGAAQNPYDDINLFLLRSHFNNRCRHIVIPAPAKCSAVNRKKRFLAFVDYEHRDAWFVVANIKICQG
eukprot:408572_1